MSAVSTRIGQFTSLRYKRRKFVNTLACAAMVLAGLSVLAVLGAVFGYVIMRGWPAVTPEFLVSLPTPVGEKGGGIINALWGSFLMVVLGSLVGIPWGLMTGIYLSEYGRGKLAYVVRFTADLLSSVPSIVIGLFIYVIIVKPMHRFSGFAGGIALGVIMVPTVARSTEELLKLVPVHIREAGLALGLPRWKVILRIVLRGSLAPITTGIMLAIARVAGETAPLLFTALNNRFFSNKLDQPLASLPVQIYTYAISPFDDWNRQAWGAAFLLVVFVFVINLVTRFIFRADAKGTQ